ncbi:hypothetical protein AB0P15_13335 [Streptomyces sp. NPDC087917]|uniref:hypothetical protein n=1 Tax=unclassified Streptomyces TaxID=2593676 RepID=UPI0034467036
MSARRPLLTALGATTLLAVLWFVPSANATAPGPSTGSDAAPAAANTGTVTGTGTGTGSIANGSDGEGHPLSDSASQGSPVSLALADTGSIDTTPYVMGGTLCLGVGAGFVAFSVRRSRTP